MRTLQATTAPAPRHTVPAARSKGGAGAEQPRARACCTVFPDVIALTAAAARCSGKRQRWPKRRKRRTRMDDESRRNSAAVGNSRRFRGPSAAPKFRAHPTACGRQAGAARRNQSNKRDDGSACSRVWSSWGGGLLAPGAGAGAGLTDTPAA